MDSGTQTQELTRARQMLYSDQALQCPDALASLKESGIKPIYITQTLGKLRLVNDEFKASLGYREKKKYMVEKLTKISPPKLIKLKKITHMTLESKTCPPIKNYSSMGIK